jgi:hypothetical protein
VLVDFRSHFDQTPDELFHYAVDFFAHEVELPPHVEEVVCSAAHKKPDQHADPIMSKDQADVFLLTTLGGQSTPQPITDER